MYVWIGKKRYEYGSEELKKALKAQRKPRNLELLNILRAHFGEQNAYPITALLKWRDKHSQERVREAEGASLSPREASILLGAVENWEPPAGQRHGFMAARKKLTHLSREELKELDD